jgi:hypothetical protein
MTLAIFLVVTISILYYEQGTIRQLNGECKLVPTELRVVAKKLQHKGIYPTRPRSTDKLYKLSTP